MKNVRIYLTLSLLFFLIFHSHSQQDSVIAAKQLKLRSIPKTGYVNDTENLLSEEGRKKLEKMISKFEKKTSNEIAIVTIENIYPYSDMADFTMDLANYWGVGKKGKNNGLMIVVSKNLRYMRIGSGLGTEKIITDEVCTEIVNLMVPYLKKDQYQKKFEEGLNQIINRWK